MTTVLWDTSVVISPPEHSGDGTQAAVSVVTLMELGSGVNAARDPATRAARLALYSQAVATFRPLPLDTDVVAAYLAIDAAVRGRGRQPRGRIADLQIAATAMAHGLPLVTRNPADFAGLDALVAVQTP
ncbi:MAG: PIN domain-containing protein [Kineosporiaceae bacterium]